MLTSPTWRLSRKDRRGTGRTEEQRALGLQVFRERVYFPQGTRCFRTWIGVTGGPGTDFRPRSVQG